MKHTTIKSNRKTNNYKDVVASIRVAFDKLLKEVQGTRSYIEQDYNGLEGCNTYKVAVYTLKNSNTALDSFLGVWEVVVSLKKDTPLKVRFFSSEDYFELHIGLYPYRPSLLPLRLARICPDWNPDDPFDGAGDFKPVRS